MSGRVGNRRAPRPAKVTYEVLLTVTDDGTDGYMTTKMIKEMLATTNKVWQYAGVKVRVGGIMMKLPPREEV